MDRPAGAEPRSYLLRHDLPQDAVAVARDALGEFSALLAATAASWLEEVGQVEHPPHVVPAGVAVPVLQRARAVAGPPRDARAPSRLAVRTSERTCEWGASSLTLTARSYQPAPAPPRSFRSSRSPLPRTSDPSPPSRPRGCRRPCP